MLADRGFYGFHLFEAARKTGADLYWRVKSTVAPRFLETLSDGSWLATIKPSGNEGRKAKGTRVRVIDYTVDDGRGGPEP